MKSWRNIFKKTTNIFGMIHVRALPGTPKYEGSMTRIIDTACQEAEIYKECGIDAVLLENMHDIPYIQSNIMGPETVSVMTKVCSEVRKILSNIPCGVQVLAGGNEEALSVALACNLQFIRAEGFVFSHVADEGLLHACAGPLLRYRHSIGADHILVLTDVKKKHSAHAITSDVSLEETVKAAEFFLSDGIILTGSSTGVAADVSELQAVRKVASGPVLIGSGVTISNVKDYLSADGLIIGSHFKHGGRWENKIDKNSVKAFTAAVKSQLKEGTVHTSV